MNVLGIDIGGSAVKGAPVNTKTGELLAERFRIPTPKKLTPIEMGNTIAEIARHFSWKKGRIGVGFPGVVERNVIRTSANLHKGFIHCDAGALFSKLIGNPVTLVNDADAAGLAEVVFGAGAGVKGNLLMLTLGTGVGSALFTDGKLYPNTEFGHLKYKGKSYERFMSAAVREKKKLSFKEWAGRVSLYLQEMEALTWPEQIIIGGGISSKHEKWFKHLKCKAKVVPARYLNTAGVIGAALAAVYLK